MTLLLNFLKNNWLVLVVIALLMSVGAFGGKLYAERNAQVQIDQINGQKAKVQGELDALKLSTEKDKTAAAQQHAAELTQALGRQQQYQHEAENLSSQLLAKQRELQEARDTFQRAIQNVIKKDGATYTGIGPHSLCAYRTSLGYPGCDERLQGADSTDAGRPGKTAGTGGGLSPAGILTHASDYGAWCQNLELKLRALKRYFNGADDKDIK